MAFTDDIKPVLNEVLKILQQDLREVLKAQGHNLTGRLSDSIEYEVSASGSVAVGRMSFEDYGVFVELGVKPGKVPFGKKVGGGKKTSLYIQALIGYWHRRGLSGREATSAAFATAHVHAREGIPSRASARYSSTGERTGFVRQALAGNVDKIEKILSEKLQATVELQFARNIGSKF